MQPGVIYWVSTLLSWRMLSFPSGVWIELLSLPVFMSVVRVDIDRG